LVESPGGGSRFQFTVSVMVSGLPELVMGFAPPVVAVTVTV